MSSHDAHLVASRDAGLAPLLVGNSADAPLSTVGVATWVVQRSTCRFGATDAPLSISGSGVGASLFLRDFAVDCVWALAPGVEAVRGASGETTYVAQGGSWTPLRCPQLSQVLLRLDGGVSVQRALEREEVDRNEWNVYVRAMEELRSIGFLLHADDPVGAPETRRAAC